MSFNVAPVTILTSSEAEYRYIEPLIFVPDELHTNDRLTITVN